MCIIVYKPAGIPCPTEAILEACFASNPDGAGLFVGRPGKQKASIQKGFMDCGSFLDFASAAVTQEDVAAYHFRITTSGGTRPESCHPFPVSREVQELRSLGLTARYAFVHNGIIGKGEDNLSDTQVYIRDSLYPLLMQNLESDALRDSIAQETEGSRTLLYDAEKGSVIMTGNWIEDKETGLFFSNRSYETFACDWGSEDDAWYYYMACPKCGGMADIISYNHEIYECAECTSVFTAKGRVLMRGNV